MDTKHNATKRLLRYIEENAASNGAIDEEGKLPDDQRGLI